MIVAAVATPHTILRVRTFTSRRLVYDVSPNSIASSLILQCEVIVEHKFD